MKSKFCVSRRYHFINTTTRLVFLTPRIEYYRNDATLDSTEYMTLKIKRVKLVNGRVSSIMTPSRYEKFCTQCKQPLRLP